MKTGKIIQIIGPVVDVEFPENEKLPEVYNALKIKRDNDELTFEVVKHLEPGRVRAISMQSTDGLKRGMEVLDTGKKIEVPVGPEILGNIFNLLGQPLNPCDKKFEKFYPIHRESPPLTEQSTKTEVLKQASRLLT